MSDQDTIAACATPPGRGGIGIVRVSGPLVKEIAVNILGKLPVPRYAQASDFLDKNGKIIDKGIAIYFSTPNSFTGEDVLELHGHGGVIILDCILQRVLELGARLAYPGEFSERAFVNGKIDLTQAEAIADLINATSMQATQYALRSLQGDFSKYIYSLIDRVTRLRMMVEAAIDFTEEEIEIISSEKIYQQINEILDELHKVQQSANEGVLIQEGLSIVIMGKPNVGKSSILNCLSGDEVAIVTPIPGTTRDILRTNIKLDDLVLQLVDTAGLHDSVDVVEQEGIRRARVEITRAQHILLVVDAEREGDKSPKELLQGYSDELNLDSDELNFIIIYNKIDLINKQPELTTIDGVPCLFISAYNKQGIDLVKDYLRSIAGIKQTTENGFSARRRHLVALASVKEHLLVSKKLVTNASLEIIAEELRLVQQELGTITGEVSNDDLLTLIFREFCIGK